MLFVPAVTPPDTLDEPAWWFIFHNNTLLVRFSENIAQIPRVSDVAELKIHSKRTQYLGTLDGKHCYAADILTREAAIPDGMAFYPLRPLYHSLSEEIFWIAGRAFQIMNWDRTHQYCGQCGHPTESVAGERAKICPQCKLTQYPRISPAIIVAVIKDQQLLLAHAPRFPKELYSVIAGFVEPGETFEDCVHREVREEVGIEVKNIRYFGSQPWPFPHSIMVGFTAQHAVGEITIDQVEILDAGWFTAGNLPKIPDKISIARKLIDWFVEQYNE